MKTRSTGVKTRGKRNKTPGTSTTSTSTTSRTSSNAPPKPKKHKHNTTAASEKPPPYKLDAIQPFKLPAADADDDYEEELALAKEMYELSKSLGTSVTYEEYIKAFHAHREEKKKSISTATASSAPPVVSPEDNGNISQAIASKPEPEPEPAGTVAFRYVGSSTVFAPPAINFPAAAASKPEPATAARYVAPSTAFAPPASWASSTVVAPPIIPPLSRNLNQPLPGGAPTFCTPNQPATAQVKRELIAGPPPPSMKQSNFASMSTGMMPNPHLNEVCSHKYPVKPSDATAPPESTSEFDDMILPDIFYSSFDDDAPPTLANRRESTSSFPSINGLDDDLDLDAIATTDAEAFWGTTAGKQQQSCIGKTPQHQAECNRLFEDLIEFIIKDEVITLDKVFRALEQGPVHHPRLVPRAIIYLSGEKNLPKTRMVNMILSQFVLQMENKKEPSQFLQPSTHTRKLRTLMGFLKNIYGWQWSLEEDFNFPGGLKAVVSEMFAERRRASEADPNRNPYGDGSKKQVVSGVSSVAELDWSAFNEDNPSEHMAKIMAICGCYFGFRGRKEHATFAVNMLLHGVFETGHPFAGYRYYGIQNLIDKTHRLSLNNCYTRHSGDSAGFIRIPVMDENDQKDPGGSIHRYIEKLSPGQMRMYCYEATRGEKLKWQHLYPKACYSPNRPLGENAIATKLKVAAKRLGLGDVSGHAFRRLLGTTLNNAEGVNVTEALKTMRHNSVAATRTYVVRDKTSETNKFNAYGFVPNRKRGG